MRWTQLDVLARSAFSRGARWLVAVVVGTALLLAARPLTGQDEVAAVVLGIGVPSGVAIGLYLRSGAMTRHPRR